MSTLSYSQTTTQPYLTPVRLVAMTNQSGTYLNGSLNNGVGATFTYSTGVLTIDSVTVALNDRILFAAQTSGLQNGIYVCTQAGTTTAAAILTRAEDQQCIEQLQTGFYVSVAAGTTYHGFIFTMVEPKPAAIGVDSIVWADATATGSGVMATLPTTAGNIAVYSNATGDITQNAATAINNGNIQAGVSGTAGTVSSFSSTAARGSLIVAAVANTGNTNTTISNAAMGQATTVSIPDPGAATANFVVSRLTGTQHITAGNLAVDNGSVESGITAGGYAGNFIAYPTAGGSGYLTLAATTNAGGNFYTSITNAASVGQNQTISVIDSGAATASFVLTESASASQTINTGILLTGPNNLVVSGGNVVAGTGGTQGTLTSFPSTNNRGNLVFSATDNTGAFSNTLTNAPTSQNTVYSIVDPLVVSAAIPVVADLPILDSLVKFDSVSGIMTNVGAQIICGFTDVWGGGATSFTFAAAGIAAGFIVTAVMFSHTNSVAISNIVAGANTINVVFTADPGANTQLQFIGLSTTVAA